MRIERLSPAIFQLTLHAYELAALMAAARWVVEGAEGEITREARENLKQLVENYDQESQRLDRSSPRSTYR